MWLTIKMKKINLSNLKLVLCYLFKKGIGIIQVYTILAQNYLIPLVSKIKKLCILLLINVYIMFYHTCQYHL